MTAELTSSLKRLGLPVREDALILLDPVTILPDDIPTSIRSKIDAVRKLMKAYQQAKTVKPKVIRYPKDAYELFKDRFYGLDHEEMHAILLRQDNSVIEVKRMTTGSISSTMIDQHGIMREMLMKCAVSVVIAHNHPSGECKPSQADINETTKLSKSLKMMNMSLIDHIIIGENKWYSFANEQAIQL